MKLLPWLAACFIIFPSFVLKAQNNDTLRVFKPGFTATYQHYQRRALSKKYYETTRIEYKTVAVKDSAGSVWAVIAKKGASFKNPVYKYELSTYIRKDAKGYHFETDYFMPDTIYLVDVPGYDRNEKYVREVRYLTGGTTTGNELNIPLEMSEQEDLGTFIAEAKGSSLMPDVNGGRIQPDGRREPNYFTYKHGPVQIKTESKAMVRGKQTISTSAGQFECYKVLLINDRFHVMLYYSPLYGIIKGESQGKRGQLISYFELVRLRK